MAGARGSCPSSCLEGSGRGAKVPAPVCLLHPAQPHLCQLPAWGLTLPVLVLGFPASCESRPWPASTSQGPPQGLCTAAVPAWKALPTPRSSREGPFSSFGTDPLSHLSLSRHHALFLQSICLSVLSYLLSITTVECQLPGVREFASLHTQCPAQGLAYSRCSIN